MNNTWTCYSFRYNSDLELPSLRITLSVLFGITSVPAVSLNSLILYSIWKNPSLHKPSYLLLANLAFADLFYGAFTQSFAILSNIAYIEKWLTEYCYFALICHFIGYWLASVSLYSLTLISIDRLLAVRLRISYRSFVTSQRIWILTLPCWGGVFLLLLALLLSNVFFFFHFFLGPGLLCVSLTIITVCYSMAFYSLKRVMSSVSSSSQQPPDNGTNTFDVSQYRRSMNTMILVLLTTLLLYLPYLGSVVAHRMTEDGGNSYYISFKALLIGQLFVAINSTVNPLLYLWRIQDIRQAVKTTVKKILRQEHHSVHAVQP